MPDYSNELELFKLAQELKEIERAYFEGTSEIGKLAAPTTKE
jgi:hypothetical protein